MSSQLASVKDFKLKKPTSYHYDFILTGSVMMLLGLIGLPPTNCVIPQAPLHTRSLKLREPGRSPRAGMARPGGADAASLEVVENRVSGLVQSLLCAVSIFLVPAIKEMPTGVLWGYFAFLAYESLAGNELFLRSTYIVTDPALLPSCLGAFAHHGAPVCARADPARGPGLVVVGLVCALREGESATGPGLSVNTCTYIVADPGAGECPGRGPGATGGALRSTRDMLGEVRVDVHGLHAACSDGSARASGTFRQAAPARVRFGRGRRRRGGAP